MIKSQRTLALVAAVVGSIPTVFVLAWAYFDAIVRSEYASRERVSTDGDTIIIPVVGVTVAWMILLLMAAGVVGIIWQVRRAKRGGS